MKLNIALAVLIVYGIVLTVVPLHEIGSLSFFSRGPIAQWLTAMKTFAVPACLAAGTFWSKRFFSVLTVVWGVFLLVMSLRAGLEVYQTVGTLEMSLAVALGAVLSLNALVTGVITVTSKNG